VAWRLLGGLLLACAATAYAADRLSAATLQERYVSLQQQFARNPFGRPLHLDSKQSEGELTGAIDAVIAHPFATVSAALDRTESWCDILILHLNVKNCHASRGPSGSALTVHIGTKYTQALDAAYQVDFDFRVVARSADLLHLLLRADRGPLGTHNYQILFAATPLDDARTFVHMSYSYEYGLMARMAMQTYLATLGRHKVGFSVIDARSGRRPVYVGGVRGVVERNTMRYYLAIVAYLDSLGAPSRDQVERRLRAWFAAVERYPLQLHELDEQEYLFMKRREISHLQSQVARRESG
jgi:hypothetical protein